MPRALKKSLPHIALLFYLLVILFPFLFVLFSSVKKDNNEIALNPFGIPKEFVFNNYVEAWVNAKISTYFFNSLYISILASVVSILLASMFAFAVTRMRQGKWNTILFSLVLVGMLIPNNALMLPIYTIVRKLGILNTHWALIIPYIANAIPFTIIILAAFMRNLPREIEEAAVMDGLKAPGIFARIIVPLTVPAMVTVFIVNFLGNWNEFLLANYFLSNDELRTLPVGMVQFRDQYQMNYAQMSAGIVFSVLPVIIIYAILQEKIIEGVTAGGVKG
ncbi:MULTISPECIES: carbohydrate ABC transporter permease [Paenibacillus]|jgi:raffinose/stachyose/melibiose transport system permease protein|uniref:Carbohydrate ABC transporter permease n=1 Tax=Paenibacillus odorifer TaxID=189426 RepID=A0A1R0XFK1_9BACL|nr:MULTISPECIES: carbohydrate ABC transporter permease [Paenibacillus]AIQ75682.1 sugar ABC transporter permease [Paenibacillus odorifer]AWV34983.1 carbohydrate ABC transporter permease [Paenibacillus odorifer]ETT57536.1 binding-protein-dependent transport systems inner membrane component [Paenibacillus sp. FSL H8-237]MDH6429713.1 raffinose/stachyose/melibiose transport system permease protein [Paenibacillus sp. PastH-4]MDH6446189.1 raffinose/stachyose/melibiose transport system permease protei